MRYIIYGAGGIGGGIGARLFQHGHEVVLICRGEHLSAIQRQGLTLKTPEDTLQQKVSAVGHPSEISFTDQDVVILTMKSQDTEQALRDLYQASNSDLPIVCGQNGVDNERMAARRFPRVYGMVVWMPGTYLEPGMVLNHATPVGGILDAGCYPNGVDALITQVTADISQSGFSAKPEPNIMRWKYTKLLANIRNALQAACGLEVKAQDFVRALRAETKACYEAAGIEFAPEDELQERVRTQIKLVDIEGYPRTGGSSWQSLKRGLPTIEADFLNGEIVLLGRQRGIPTPYNHVLQNVANQMASSGQQPGSFSIEQLQRMVDEGAEIRA
jgi:2-dehydropantoate 2-reductase